VDDPEDYPIATQRELLAKVERVVGYLPIGTTDLLRVLAHPDVVRLTRRYLDAVDRAT
jgi:hypothetical protein